MTLTDVAEATADRREAVTTVASLARGWAQRSPKQVSMREKDFGIWREYTWEETWGLIEDAAHGLLALGVAPGDRVSIHCEDRPEWIILDLATVAVRGITVGLYPTNPTAEVEYLLDRLAAPRSTSPRTRNRSTRSSGSTASGSPTCSGSSSSSRGAWSATTTIGCCSGTTSWSSVASTSAQHPEAVDATMASAELGRRDDARLHVGHHRAAEGGDAHQQERRVLASTSSSTTRTGSPADHRTRTT